MSRADDNGSLRKTHERAGGRRKVNTSRGGYLPAGRPARARSPEAAETDHQVCAITCSPGGSGCRISVHPAASAAVTCCATQEPNNTAGEVVRRSLGGRRALLAGAGGQATGVFFRPPEPAAVRSHSRRTAGRSQVRRRGAVDENLIRQRGRRGVFARADL